MEYFCILWFKTKQQNRKLYLANSEMESEMFILNIKPTTSVNLKICKIIWQFFKCTLINIRIKFIGILWHKKLITRNSKKKYKRNMKKLGHYLPIHWFEHGCVSVTIILFHCWLLRLKLDFPLFLFGEKWNCLYICCSTTVVHNIKF